MIRKQLQICDPIGIHARPAAEVSELAKKFLSKITIKYNDKEANVKSILSLMTLGIGQNVHFILEIEGNDEEAACQAIIGIMKAKKLIN